MEVQDSTTSYDTNVPESIIEPLHVVSSKLMAEHWMATIEDGLKQEAILGSTKYPESFPKSRFLSDDLDSTVPCFDIEDRKVDKISCWQHMLWLSHMFFFRFARNVFLDSAPVKSSTRLKRPRRTMARGSCASEMRGHSSFVRHAI